MTSTALVLLGGAWSGGAVATGDGPRTPGEGGAARSAAAADTPVGQFVLAVEPDGARAAVGNRGTAPLRVDVVTQDGSRLLAVTGRAGDTAARFPGFDPAASGPRAVVRVRGDGDGPDRLDPGGGDLVFGADVRLAAQSASKAGGSHDDGNNVIQRGLFGEVTQYKIQVDGGYPVCRIKGRSGTITVTARPRVTPDHWYRLVCARAGHTVTLSVTTWDAGGSPVVREATGSEVTGSLRPAHHRTPLAVGGKLTTSGAIESRSDQFNGLLERAFVRIGDGDPPVDPPPDPPGDDPAPPSAAPHVMLRVHVDHVRARSGARVRFAGKVRPKGLTRHDTVRLAFRSRGTHGFHRLATATAGAQARFRFAKVRVRAGVYRVAVPQTARHGRAKVKLRYAHGRFR